MMHLFELSKIGSLTLPLLLSGLFLIMFLRLNWFESLNIPIDLRFTLHNKRFFGDNKTFRGVLVMVLMGIIVCGFLNIMYIRGYSEYIHPVFKNSPVILGLIYSISYISGELINSFIKRQKNVPPGGIANQKYENIQTFFDLSDGIILTILALIILTSVKPGEAIIAGGIGVFLHHLTDVLMKRLRLKH